MEKQKKAIIIIVVCLLILVPLGLYLIDVFKTARVNIRVAPASSEITLNGKKYSNGEYKLYPGTYEIIISKSGFEEYKETIELKKDDIIDIYKCLKQNDVEEWNDPDSWYSNNKEDYSICWNIKERELAIAEKEKFARDDIFKYAPYHSYDDGFYIDPYFDEDDKVVIRVTLLSCQETKREILKERAIEWLKNNVDLEKYQIVYQSGCESRTKAQ